jgi:hypothetical protein
MMIREAPSQDLQSEAIENLKLNNEVINISNKASVVGSSKAQSSSKKSSKNVSHSGVSLKSGTSAVSKSSKLKTSSRWIKGKLSKTASSSLAVTSAQSKELQKLKKNTEDRKASFENSLEVNSYDRNSHLLRQSVNTQVSEKSNE